MHRAALLSDCGRFRYRLSRRWAEGPALAWIALNPSTADGETDDATVRKVVGFSRRLGFPAFDLVNLFAYRATDPQDLRRAGYPVGPDNDAHIEAICRWAPAVVCAWGSNAFNLQRPAEVLRLFAAWKVKPMALRINRGGIPAHPLMLSYGVNTPAGRAPRQLVEF